MFCVVKLVVSTLLTAYGCVQIRTGGLVQLQTRQEHTSTSAGQHQRDRGSDWLDGDGYIIVEAE
jgi:hypothetical protein